MRSCCRRPGMLLQAFWLCLWTGASAVAVCVDCCVDQTVTLFGMLTGCVSMPAQHNDSRSTQQPTSNRNQHSSTPGLNSKHHTRSVNTGLDRTRQHCTQPHTGRCRCLQEGLQHKATVRKLSICCCAAAKSQACAGAHAVRFACCCSIWPGATSKHPEEARVLRKARATFCPSKTTKLPPSVVYQVASYRRILMIYCTVHNCFPLSTTHTHTPCCLTAHPVQPVPGTTSPVIHLVFSHTCWVFDLLTMQLLQAQKKPASLAAHTTDN